MNILCIADAAELIRNNSIQCENMTINVVASPPRNTVRVDVKTPNMDVEDIRNFLESEEFSSIGIQDVIMQSDHMCAITESEKGY